MTIRVATLLGLLSACAPTNLLKATTNYTTTSTLAIEELTATADVVTSICHERAEVEYLEFAQHQIGKPTTFASFYATQEHEIPESPGKLTASWKQQCEAYAAGDRRFSRLLFVVGAYGAALGAFAGDNSDLGPPLGEAIKTVGAEIATKLPTMTRYKPLLGGLGEPVGRLASALEIQWKGKELDTLVQASELDVDTILDHLAAYVKAVRTYEVRDVRAAIGDVTAAMRAVIAVQPTSPPSALAQLQQISAGFVEIEFEARISVIERRLGTLSDLIQKLREANTVLAAGWRLGEQAGASTVRTMASLANEIRIDIQKFGNPMTGAGS